MICAPIGSFEVGLEDVLRGRTKEFLSQCGGIQPLKVCGMICESSHRLFANSGYRGKICFFYQCCVTLLCKVQDLKY